MRAKAKAESLDIDLSACGRLEAKATPAALASLSQEMAAQAGEDLAMAKTVIAPELDITNAKVRANVRNAVAEARVILNQGVKGMPSLRHGPRLSKPRIVHHLRG